MGVFFQWLSGQLKQHPLRTNIVLTTFIGMCGDIICQTVYEPIIGIRRIAPNALPPESFSSPLLLRVRSPALMWKQRRHAVAQADGASWVEGTAESYPSPYVYLDLRRSLIFCSFSCIFSVPYFLWVYRRLDKLYPPAAVTKRQAIYKGFISYIAANLTTPLYMAHVTTLDRFIIYRDGRDGRRRIPSSHSPGAVPVAAGRHQPPATFISEDKAFNLQELGKCVRHDLIKRLCNDFPDVLRYGIFFWGVNWLPMFYYIPPHFRLLYSACLQVAWSGIMSSGTGAASSMTDPDTAVLFSQSSRLTAESTPPLNHRNQNSHLKKQTINKPLR
eukprot:gene4162-3003_t